MKTATFLIYVDACRYDYISKENTPFLKELSNKGFFGKVKTVPGFTQEVAMMTGKYPRETGYFTWYRYKPGNSSFSWVHPFRFLNFLRRFRLYYPIKVGVRMITTLFSGEEYQDPAFIPLDILGYFENVSATLPSNLPNLVSLCRLSKHTCFEQTMIYGFVGTKKCSRLFEAVLESLEHGNPSDLYIIHVGELDGLGHRYGPHPELFRERLKEIDFWIRKIYERAKQQGLNCNLIVTSDHGMADVRRIIDVEGVLKKIPLKVPDDYVYFLDSTMARFWFSNENAEQIVREALLSILNGHILSLEEKQQLRIDCGSGSCGELLFWADKGCLIFPNFFQSITPEKTRGMHGYMNDEDGALLVYSDEKNVKDMIKSNVVPLTDIFGITRELVGF